MFNYEELDALATDAKDKLKQQNETVGENGNIYEDLMVGSEAVKLEKSPHVAIDNSNVGIDNSDIDFDKLYDIAKVKYEEEEVPTLNQYDELLFPGGPGKLQIDTWKKDWDGYDVYITEILNQTFIFRTINRFEYKQLITLQNVDALQREEVICQTVTLWPENYTWKEMATTLAGVPSTYAEIIMEKSGFTKDYAIQVL